jgi:PAT family beta-lactamase induction signal transducer AmpG
MSRPPTVGPLFLVLFAALYALQGVVVAYLFNFNKPYMERAGLRVDVIGLVQTLALLPMVLKFLVGPVSDRWNLFGLGHRKPYIAIGLAVQAAGLLGLAVVDPSRLLPAFAACAVLAVTGLAVYDTCCDGMVVDLTPPALRARVQSILWTSRFVSATVFTLGFGAWIQRLGGPGHADRVLFACAAMSLPPLVLALCLREPARPAGAERFDWSALRVMVRPRSLVLLAFGCLYGLVGLGVESNLSLYYGRRNLGAGSDLGVLGACRNLGRAAGALVLPIALTRLGRGAVLGLGIVGLAATIAGQTAVRTRVGGGILGFAFGAANGWDDALFAVLAMEASDPRMAASTFALFMAVTNASVLGDAIFARGVRISGGFSTPLLAAAGLTLVALPLIGPLRQRLAPRPEPDDVWTG